MKTLGKLEPETLARHTDAVVEMLEDPSLDVCCWALIALKKLPPAIGKLTKLTLLCAASAPPLPSCLEIESSC